MASPTFFMAQITSSAGMALPMPARLSSAATKAPATPAALRLMQGISTRPATGSHTRPRIFFSAMATASATCRGVPPQSSVMAAAAMAAALPHSAWQPPWAPATLALFVITMPTALAVNRAITQAWRAQPRSCCMVKRAAGKMPQLPAVGAATTRPMAAFHSLTASARYKAPPSTPPVMLCPPCTARRILNALPPVSPLAERSCSLHPGSMQAAITA